MYYFGHKFNNIVEIRTQVTSEKTNERTSRNKRKQLLLFFLHHKVMEFYPSERNM